MFIESIKRYQKKPAIIYNQLKITYEQLYRELLRFGKYLSSKGIKENDCIAIALPNCPEVVISFFSAAKLNAIALLLNPVFKEDEFKYYISDSRAKVIITDNIRADICRSVISQLNWNIELIVVNETDFLGISLQDIDQEIAAYHKDVLYQYSSGSTGRPKRVCRTQKNLYYQAINCTSTLNITADDNILCIIPLFHAYGFGDCLLAAMYTGATLVILEQFIQNETLVEVPFVFRRSRVLELLEKEKITILPGVPYIFNILADTACDTQVDLSNLRLCISAGNFLSKQTFDKFFQRFGIPIRQLYGCTEAGSVCINLDINAEIQYDSVGLPMKNVEIKILDPEGDELPHGLIGEIAIKSETLTSGYFNMPHLNQEVFNDGCFLTGDLGKKDEDGRLYITGRKKVFIDTGGYKVDPLEVENILMAHPKVSEVVVVGTKGPLEGEIIKAVIVPKDDCKEQDIFSYCRDKLAAFKVPRIIEFRTEIPKSTLGKILRKDLI